MLLPSSNYCNSAEVLAFISLVYLRGLLGQVERNISFNSLTGSRVFGATMSKNRFRFLLLHVSFDKLHIRAHRRTFDIFARF